MKTYLASARWNLGIVYVLVSYIPTGSSEIKLVGQSDPVFAHQNFSVILPCYLEPRSSAEDMIVEWTRTDQPGKVCVYIDPHITVEHPAYEGRASMSLEEVKKGDLSLTLKQIKIVDAGTYTCRLPRENKETTIQLKVGSIDEVLKSERKEKEKLQKQIDELRNKADELRNKAESERKEKEKLQKQIDELRNKAVGVGVGVGVGVLVLVGVVGGICLRKRKGRAEPGH